MTREYLPYLVSQNPELIKKLLRERKLIYISLVDDDQPTLHPYMTKIVAGITDTKIMIPFSQFQAWELYRQRFKIDSKEIKLYLPRATSKSILHCQAGLCTLNIVYTEERSRCRRTVSCLRNPNHNLVSGICIIYKELQTHQVCLLLPPVCPSLQCLQFILLDTYGSPGHL